MGGIIKESAGRGIDDRKTITMNQIITNDTPIVTLTVGQLKEILKEIEVIPEPQPIKSEKKLVYGIAGIARLFGCSIPTAQQIKNSGKIDKALTQIGRKIVVDADLALELAGRKTGGRR